MLHPHVGMTVWVYDENHRVYKRDENGRACGGPIWREHWRPMEIVGETSRSWLIGMPGLHPKWADKVPKRNFPPPNVATSQDQIDRREFVIESRYHLSRRVAECSDYETLKGVSDLLDAHDNNKDSAASR